MGAGEIFKSLLLCASFGLPQSLAVAQQDHWRTVSGVALQSLFKDKEFGDGVHFAYQFKANGTFTGTEMSKPVSGSWQVRDNEFCWKWLRPPGPDECYQVQRDGARVRLMINDSEAWYGTLEALR